MVSADHTRAVAWFVLRVEFHHSQLRSRVSKQFDKRLISNINGQVSCHEPHDMNEVYASILHEQLNGIALFC